MDTLPGLRNDTITTACISYRGRSKWNDCDNGFNNGGAPLQITTPEYQYGVQVAKNDSVIAFYDASDACANYKQDYPKTSCKNGYGTVNSIVQKYRESAPFKTGFVNGAVNGNVTEACKNFRNRDMASCQNACYYGKDPLGISPIHCSDIANSCLLNQLPGPPLPPPGITTGLPPVGLPPVSVICCQFGSHNLVRLCLSFPQYASIVNVAMIQDGYQMKINVKTSGLNRLSPYFTSIVGGRSSAALFGGRNDTVTFPRLDGQYGIWNNMGNNNRN